MDCEAQIRRWHIESDNDVLINDLTSRIAQLSEETIKSNGFFSMVLAGGSTPKTFYEQLIHLNTDWSCWKIYFGDERCLPTNHPDRNDTMATKAWLNHIDIPAQNIFPIAAENGADGAKAYANVIRNVDYFDLVLLGVGEDGHTASLFPNDYSGIKENSPDVLAVFDAPKFPLERISLSAKCLSRGRNVWFLALGWPKYDALDRWAKGEALPVSYIKPKAGVDIFTDLSLIF